MLRITVVTEARRTVLKAEGKLSGPWVQELDRYWRMASDRHPGEPIVIDLSEVEFVDSTGKELIRKMCACEVELVARGPLVTSIVDAMRADVREGRSERRRSNEPKEDRNEEKVISH